MKNLASKLTSSATSFVKRNITGEWMPSEYALGHMFRAYYRLKKLNNLREKLQKKGGLKQSNLIRVIEDEHEIKKRLDLLRLHLENTKSKEIEGERYLLLSTRIMEIIEYAASIESRYKSRFGVLPDYHPGDPYKVPTELKKKK